MVSIILFVGCSIIVLRFLDEENFQSIIFLMWIKLYKISVDHPPMYFHVFPCIEKIMRYKRKELKNKLTYIRKLYNKDKIERCISMINR